MMRVLLLPCLCTAMPELDVLEQIKDLQNMNDYGSKPDMKYELIMKSQPGQQFNDHGGYCGSWSIGRTMLTKGAYISEQMVRDHTSPSPGAPASHDNEILSPNIDEALTNLKIKAEHFDYRTMPLPQQPAYFKWLKKQLTSGNPVVWMIMWSGSRYPAYNMKVPEGVHGHIEPVIGFLSNHPLTDDVVYDDDVVAHFDDNGYDTIYKPISELSGTWSARSYSDCDHGSYCIGPYSYGWAMQGFLDEQEGMPLTLSITPWKSEPNTRAGAAPIDIKGTVTATGLTAGSQYYIYRWDTVAEAFTYDDKYKMTTFTASSDSYVMEDPQPFSSHSTTYYRCVESSTLGLVV